MDTLISSPSAAYRALEGFDPAHIGLIFDPGTMVNEGFEDYQKSFELLGDYIAHILSLIHIWGNVLATPFSLCSNVAPHIPAGSACLLYTSRCV